MSLISIKNLTINFKANQNVVNNVDIEIPRGKTVAIVGESGSGKTLSALSILRLLPVNANISCGSIVFKESDLLKLPLNEIEKIRGNKISTIFQEPMSSLNPLHTVDKQIKEMITTHNKKNIEELNESVLNLLKEVNLEDLINRPNIYSYELSGGQRQRVALARAFFHDREVLVMDESTSSLDKDTEKEIVNEIKRLKGQVTIIIVSHNMSTLVNCDKVYKLSAGKLSLVSQPLTLQ